MKNRGMVELDGSYGEGGGQVVRTATCLAAVTGSPCRIFNVRAKRETPGLMRQHLFGLRALRALCNGTLKGDTIGSNEIYFVPGKIQAGEVEIELATAASITAVLQSLVPAALFAPSPVKISFKGGATDTWRAATFDYFRYVLAGILQKHGVDVRVEILRRGYYPPGGSQVQVTVSPSKLRDFSLTERSALKSIVIYSSASDILRLRRVAERQADAAEAALRQRVTETIEQRIEYSPSVSPGSACCVVAEFLNTLLGGDRIGRPGKRAEFVGAEAATDLARELRSSACLDRHMADQILPYMALGEGESSVTVSELTKHAQTNIWVIEHFISGKFEVFDKTMRWIPQARMQVH